MTQFVAERVLVRRSNGITVAQTNLGVCDPCMLELPKRLRKSLPGIEAVIVACEFSHVIVVAACELSDHRISRLEYALDEAITDCLQLHLSR